MTGVAALLKLVAGVVIGVPLLAYLVQDRLMFFPQSLSDARATEIAHRFPAARSVSLAAADGVSLHAWHVKAGPHAPLVLYFGGNAEEVSWMLHAIGNPTAGETPGVSWLLIDFRGYGRSGGSPSEKALIADALAFHDRFVQASAETKPRVFAFGRSLGSGVAVALAAARPLAGVVLVTPFDSALAVAQRHYPYLPVRWLLKHPFDSIGRAPALRMPLLALIAGRDALIPPEHAQRLVAAWGGPTRAIVLPAADHNSTDEAPGFWDEIRRFLHASRGPVPAATGVRPEPVKE